MRALSPDTEAVGSQVSGLRETRKWLLFLLLTEAWLFAGLVGAANWARLPATDRACLVLGASLLASGWLLARRPVGPWLVAAAPLCLVAAAALNVPSPESTTWIAISVSASHVAYAVVLLAPPVAGLASIGALATALALIWERRPGNVVPGAIAVAGGSIAIATLVVSALALWAAWHVLLRRAEGADAAHLALTERIAGEIETQERSHQWRVAVVRVHERLLSTIRYLLQSPSIDRDGLRNLGSSGERSTLAAPADLAASVRHATAARIAAGIITIDPSTIDLPVSPEARIACRAAIVECALNAVLHGDATRVAVAARAEGQMWRVTITDNGRGIPDDATPGLGWSKVLGDGLASAGGHWTHERIGDETVITLFLPDQSAQSRLLPDDASFRQGRVLISVPMMAMGAVAIAYDAVAGLTSDMGLLLPIIGALAVLAGVLVIAHARVPRLAVSAIALLGFATLPYLLAQAVKTGASPTVAAAAVTAAGYALIAVSVWSPWWLWVPGGIAWTAGVLVLAGADALGDRQPIVIALVNCLIIIPVVVVVSAIGTRRFARAQRALELEREVIRREAVRANSAELIDRQLAACVSQADAIVAAIAEGAELDDRTRHELACLEGLIRATIQVDPISSGEFTRTAARLVNSAFSRSIPAQVGTLASSPDPAPLPAEVLTLLEDAIAASSAVAVRVLSDGSRDYLALELVDPAADPGERLDALIREIAPGLAAETFLDPGGNAIVTVSRPVAAAVS